MNGGSRGGRYQLRSRIATGGMGEVWRSEDTLLEREVAVKVLKSEYADDPVFRSRFEDEARHAAALHHPNVASVFDFGEMLEGDGADTRRPFLVMELVPGQPLSALLAGGRPMPPETAVSLVAQAADAIAAAHALGIVHRDVKPANLLVTPEGTVKITDFGIARAADAAAVTQTGQIVGTPYYISPEQAAGHPASEASDVYALGVVLYECLAGRRPFTRDTPLQVALAHLRDPVPPLPDSVPARLRAIVDKALQKRPEDRFASAADLALALRGDDVPGLATAGPDAAAGGSPGPAGTLVLEAPVAPTGPVAARGDRTRRGLPPWWPWAAAAAAALALVVAATALAGSGEPVQDSGRQATPQKSLDDDRIRVRAARFIGEDVGEAKQDLRALGFSDVVSEEVVATAGDQTGTVASVRPTGLVAPDTRITLAYYGEYVPIDEGDEGDERGKDEEKKDEGKGDEGKGDEKDHEPKGKSKGEKD